MTSKLPQLLSVYPKLSRSWRACCAAGLCVLVVTASLFPLGRIAAERDVVDETPDAAEIQRQMDALMEDPNAPEEWLELRRLREELRRLESEGKEKAQALRERADELQRSEPVRERWREIYSLRDNKLSRAFVVFTRKIEEEGRRQQELRHGALSELTVADVPEGRDLGLSVLTYPHVEGSTSTNPLAVIIACKLLDVPYEWQQGNRLTGRWHMTPFRHRGRYDTTSSDVGYGASLYDMRGGTTLSLSLAGYRPRATAPHGEMHLERAAAMINQILTRHSGTHEAYISVIKGDSDIALIAREPSEEELALAEEHGVQLDVRPAARDAFVFISHANNPVVSLALDQIRAIYTGKLVNWNEIGGVDAEITPYQRDPQSGSQELMESLVMRGQEMMAEDPEKPLFRGVPPMLVGMSEPYIALTRDESGLAYSVYYYAYYMIGSPKTKLVAIDGVMPTYDTIRDKSYPLTADVYVVARKDLPEDSPTARWREWLLSPEGQSVVRESGYVPVLETLTE